MSASLRGEAAAADERPRRFQAEDRSGYEVDTRRAAGLAVAVLVRLGFSGGELGVTYVTAGEMAQLNHEYMGREDATDVLSFPLEAGAAEVEAGFLAELEAEEQVILASLMSSPGSGSDEVPLLLGMWSSARKWRKGRRPDWATPWLRNSACCSFMEFFISPVTIMNRTTAGWNNCKKLFDEMCVE